MFTQRDFVELAGRITDVLPSVILDRLDRSTRLFLGHGLADDSIESLVRELNHRRANTPSTTVQANRRSWAVQLMPNPTNKIYWHELGVEIVDTSLESVSRGTLPFSLPGTS